ncbi:MAG: HAMP domain-containing histidine kinase [Cyclobacteriaceae bacterium]|nr:HAMP domain-containing histidine kinase [Cyclobacteriaceae bacterium]
MNIFLVGIKQEDRARNADEIIYSNIASIIVSFAAFAIFLILLKSYGWMVPVYIALGMVFFINLTIVLNYIGFTLSSRIFLSLLPPFVILGGDLLTLTVIPDGTHPFSFDIRILILSVVVLPVLLFTMKERAYIAISLAFNAIILLFFDYIHTLFGINLSNTFGAHYYISTLFYAIAFLFIVTTLLIFKVRWSKLNKVNKGLLFGLEQKVTERTQELELHSQELVKHNNELEQFSFTVSHNVRGPIARLLGLTDLFTKLDANEQGTIIKQIRATTKTLDTVISDLNEILQIRNNLYSVKEHVNIYEEIGKARQLLSGANREMASLKNIVLHIKVKKIFGVRGYIQSILYNLIGNAFKYKQEGVNLKVKVSTELKGKNVLLKIEDNGRGIDLERFGGKMFKMYSRFNIETKGKGLGLYLVKQQVESMNGSITVKSKINQGTTFSILLPIPDSSQIENQVYYESDVAVFTFNGLLKTSLIFWKKNPLPDEFRKIISSNIKNLSIYTTDFWINDTTFFGSLSEENQKWFNEKAMPAILQSGIKGIIMINKEGKGFKSSQFNLLKHICTLKGIVLTFKYDIKEANAFIAAFNEEAKFVEIPENEAG